MPWVKPSRWGVLFLVAAVHLGLIATLLSTAGNPAAHAPLPAVHVLFLAPTRPPPIRSEHALPQFVNWGVDRQVAFPTLASTPAGEAPPSATSSDGTGAGVGWAAEARRALNAYEIRSHLPPTNNSVSGDQAEVWLRQAHHAGDRLKTANGDWIVWLDAKCYQLATSAQAGWAQAPVIPPVICPGYPDPATSRSR
jgi:hypothetical protein